MVKLSSPLLAMSPGEEMAPLPLPFRQRWRRSLLTSGVLLAGVGMMCLSAQMGYVDSDKWFKIAQMYTGPLPETEMKGNMRHWLQCVTYTGGTCTFRHCNYERGPTTCRRNVLLSYCYCQEGYCSDTAGRCHEEPNKVVAKSITFKNAQWPEYCLSLQQYGYSVEVDQDCGSNRAKWNLYEVPWSSAAATRYKAPLKNRRFMLGNVMYPTYTAELVRGQYCEKCYDGSDSNGNRQYRDCNCRPTFTPLAKQVIKMEMSHLLRLTPASWQEPAVMIESATAVGRPWQVHPYSWTVTAPRGYDPGPQGYWIPDPPLDLKGMPQNFQDPDDPDDPDDPNGDGPY